MSGAMRSSDHSVATARGIISVKDDRCSEIELKLSGGADELAAVFDSIKNGHSRESRLVSTYYDTTDNRLWRRGYSFRLRRKRGGHELTLKHEKGFVRGEWTSCVETPVADTSRLPETAPHDELGLGPSELAPVFASEISRRQHRLKANAACIEVSLDRGRIVAGACATPVAELEFELLSGPVADMLHHVRTIVADHRLCAFTSSKAARGMALLDGAVSASTKAPKLHLHPENTVDEAVRQFLAGVVTHILQNIHIAAAGRDPEGVHQVRIALRRLRSAMGLFRPYLHRRAAAMNKRARRALRRLGTARDIDVLVLETLPGILKDGAFDQSLPGLAEILREPTADAHRDVRSLAFDPPFNCFLVDLLLAAQCGGLVVCERDTAVGRIARPLLQKRHRQLLKAGRNFAELTDRQRHRVRIALKKLRYACDIFRALYPADAADAYIRRLANLQKHLGRLNDVVVAEHLAADLLAGYDDTAIAARDLKRLFDNRRRDIGSRLPAKWERVARAEPFWRSGTVVTR